MLLVASGLKDALIGKDEVAAAADDLGDLVSQLDGQVGILLVEFVLLLRHVLGLDLLELEAIELEDLANVLGLDDTIRELSMEQLGSLRETKMRLFTYVDWVHEVFLLLVLHSSKGHSLGSMQLARIELRWLDAVPLGFQLLLGKMMPYHPPDLFEWHAQQIGDETNRDDGLCIYGRFFGAIS